MNLTTLDLPQRAAPRVIRVSPGGLADALGNLSPGDRLVLEPGIYRESIRMLRSGTARAPITIEAREPGTVVITGTDLVTGWQPLAPGGSVWWVDIDLTHLPEAEKYGLPAGRCEQVFVDGMALRQVMHAGEMRGGTFRYDRDIKRLFIRPQVFASGKSGGRRSIDAGGITGGGSVSVDLDDPANHWQFLTDEFDPSAHRIEVAMRGRIFDNAENPAMPGANHELSGASHLVIRGLVFRGSADLPQQPMVRFCGSHLLIEDCLFEAGAARGFDLRCNQSVMRRCTSRLNGQMGFSGYGRDNLVEDCALLFNNTKHSDFVCFEQGGCKIVRSSRFVMRRVRTIGNDGPGIWYDIDNTHALIEQCRCERNSGPGIMYEISSDAVIRNNVCVHNGFAARKDWRFDSIGNSVGHIEPVYGQGILVQMSRRVKVHNNTCVGNRRCGIELRHHPYQQAGAHNHSTETYRLEHNEVFNNIMADNGWDNLMVSLPPANPAKTDEVRDNHHDHNLFHHSGSLIQHGGDLLAYSRWGKTQHAGSMSLEEWRAARHKDLHSIQWDPMFHSPDTGDFRVEIGSPAESRGKPVAGFDMDFHGYPRNPDSPTIGAFEPSTCDMPRPTRVASQA